MVRGRVDTGLLKEFDLLEYLIRNSGAVLTRQQLIERVWGPNFYGDTNTLDVHIKRLRAKIEDDPAYPVHLVTARGLGYRLGKTPTRHSQPRRATTSYRHLTRAEARRYALSATAASAV